MSLTLLIGGARAGKSGVATAMATAWEGPVVFVATAEARDDEMAERIARHRTSRPDGWTTIETPDDIAGAIRASAAGAFVIVDCLTLWTSGLMERELADAQISRRAREAATVAAERSSPTVVVTNEVGSGIVPDNPIARRFRDVLGNVNAIWADAADAVLLVVAGRTLPLSRMEEPDDG